MRPEDLVNKWVAVVERTKETQARKKEKERPKTPSR